MSVNNAQEKQECVYKEMF